MKADTRPSLYRLVYYSRNLIHGKPDAMTLEIAEILSTSQRNNSRTELTGALIFNSGIFAQVLEGDRSSIEETFERIQRDERHADVQVLAFEEVKTRAFPQWSMAFLGQSKESENLFGHISRDTGFEGKRMEGERIFSIMRQIAIEEENVHAA
jgi:FAD-dependent sensor of blue light